MPSIKRAKILSTCRYEFFEGGNIHTIATSPDKLLRRTNQPTSSDLRKSGIHKPFGELVVHACIVAVLPRRVEKAASCFHAFSFDTPFGMSAVGPIADMCSGHQPRSHFLIFERKQKDRLAAVSPKNSITLTSLSSAAY